MTAILNDPTFWVLVAFVVFVAAFSRPIARAITAGLDKRSDKIRADLEEAENLLEEAQDLLAGYQRKQRDAAKESEAIVKRAREEAERLVIQGHERLEATVERRRKLALDHIAQAEAQAIDEVRARTVDVAIAAARDYLAETMTAKDADALVDQAIKDLPKKLH